MSPTEGNFPVETPPETSTIWFRREQLHSLPGTFVFIAALDPPGPQGCFFLTFPLL